MKKFLRFLIGLLVGISAIFIIVLIGMRLRRGVFEKNKACSVEQPKKIVWLNIFVHGTFGTTMGMLSVQSLLKDEVRGTVYRGVNKEMRDNPVFFQTQPILKRGLHAITPSFDKQEGVENLYAVYPLTKTFDGFLQATSRDVVAQKYYTFGWSGLISQHRRRFEAIRFFNALQEEFMVLRKQNIEPHVRVIAHSHGGNLCLNLGAIDAVLKAKTLNTLHKYSADYAADDSIKKMLEIMKMLGTKELAAAAPDIQKKLDYVPIEKNISIDELILLGTPIQSETEHFLTSPIFKTIYNVYSDQDEIQRLDWVSTRSKVSKQRIDESIIAQVIKNKGVSPRIVQIKIMYERDVVQLPDKQNFTIKTEQQKASFVDQLLGADSGGKDPNHRALWFVGFDKNQAAETQSYIWPLPTSVMMPPIIALIARNTMYNDVDINIALHDDCIKFFLIHHQDDKVVDHISIQKSLFEEIKQKIMPWVPSKDVSKKEFDAVYQYITHLKPHVSKPPVEEGLKKV